MSDEFYIGYEPRMPAGLASRIRPVARALIAGALLLPALLVSTQARFSSGVFEFGHPQIFRGRIIEFPYPALIVSDAAGVSATYWLVGQGKHGAANLVRGRNGQHVELSGTLIRRDDDAMIEVASDAMTTMKDDTRAPIEPLRSLGAIAVEGEIVDSKCHLGVMKPGDGPTHRDCAVRCLLGRVPPMFVPHDHTLGRLSLVSLDRRAFEDDARRWAGRAVSIRGEVLQRGAQRFLATSPSAIRILE